MNERWLVEWMDGQRVTIDVEWIGFGSEPSVTEGEQTLEFSWKDGRKSIFPFSNIRSLTKMTITDQVKE